LAVPRDPELFAGAIVNLLSNPALRTKMGKNARELVTDYSWEKSGERLARTLGSILARRPLPKDLIGERPPELELAQ
jgi:glycosyltransferase involved in cell wall biosynthesis